MGSMIGWHCEDCHAGEQFFSGSGMLSFNEPSVIEHAANGCPTCGSKNTVLDMANWD